MEHRTDPTPAPPWKRRWRLFATLTKLRLSAMVLVTAGAGFLLAPGTHPPLLLAAALTGTALTCSGAMALNEWWEVELDRRMERTRRRPMVTGELGLGQGLAIGLALASAGTLVLAALVNVLTAAVGAAIVAMYLLVYTPLKTRSSLCTLAGAVCGGLPPLMGWTAVTGRIGFGGLALAALLFLWQIPHFLALSWIYRDDYRAAGFRMLSLGDPSGARTSRMAAIYALALFPASLALIPVASAGAVYLTGAFLMTSILLALTLRWNRTRSLRHARLVFRATLLYLPLVLGLLLADRTPPPVRVASLAPAAVAQPAGGAPLRPAVRR